MLALYVVLPLLLLPSAVALCALAHKVMGPSCAVLYVDAGCRGPFTAVDIGDQIPLFNSTIIPSNSASSLAVRQNCLLEVFTQAYFGGSSWIYHPGVWKSLENERFDDRISSVRCYCTNRMKWCEE